jgi:hypothetical protein
MTPPPPDSGHEPEPDPDELVQRWEVAACVVCGRTIWRRARRRQRDGWRHLHAGWLGNDL